jgi:NAD(P)-dependent dehydrogenase (short-subunit alcohol dehydrogenase family)
MPVAIVTGASRGFGRADALDLAARGWSLVIDARHADALDVVAREARDAGVDVTALAGDVTDAEHRRALVEAASQWGSLDLLINNASTLGPSPLPPLTRYPLDELRRVYEVDVVAPLALVQDALTLLRRSGGMVVSVTSDASVEAYEGWGGYGSAKAALDQLHRVLAVEDPGLRFYLFDPGDMRTDMHQAAYPGEDISDRPEPETVVPALQRLLASGAASGRYRSDEWRAS